jgi:hypothetical protein
MQEQNGDTAPRLLVIEVNSADVNFRHIVLLFFFPVFSKSNHRGHGEEILSSGSCKNACSLPLWALKSLISLPPPATTPQKNNNPILLPSSDK